jgi:23S rRNA (adenine2503-C2)-methyltransferase
MGLARNLSTAEIVGQVWVANRWISENSGWLTERRLPNFMKVTNVVFMGMGEPLDNVESVANAITILTDPYGPHIAKRRISVSTAGHLDGLEEILKIHPDVRLALSVHSPENSERSKIMPINRKWPLKDILDKLRSLPIQQKQGLLLQYTLISGVNDSDEHAAKLIDLINDMNVKVNLIPLNPVGPSRLKGPTMDRVVQFRDKIYGAGVRVLVRYSKGQDIAAACGQLVVPPKT